MNRLRLDLQKALFLLFKGYKLLSLNFLFLFFWFFLDLWWNCEIAAFSNHHFYYFCYVEDVSSALGEIWIIMLEIGYSQFKKKLTELF